MKTICITCKNDCNNAGTTARISWCPQYKPGRILSNADRIRAMSDADLARWLEYEGGGACAEVYGWLAWLQQPAEEGNNEKLDINAVCFGILCNFTPVCGEERAKEAVERRTTSG